MLGGKSNVDTGSQNIEMRLKLCCLDHKRASVIEIAFCMRCRMLVYIVGRIVPEDLLLLLLLFLLLLLSKFA